MYELKLNFDSLSKLQTFVAGLGVQGPPAVVVPATVTPEKQDAAIASVEAKRGPGRPRKEPEVVGQEPAPVGPEAPATPVEALAATLSYEADVAPLIAKAAGRDRDATVKMLEDLGARDSETKKLTGKALAPGKFAEAIERANAIINGSGDLT